MIGATPWRRRTWLVPLVPVLALALAAGWVALPHFTAQTTTRTEALTPMADTYVRSDIPAGFYGSSPRVSAQTTAGQTRVAYLSFEVPVARGRPPSSTPPCGCAPWWAPPAAVCSCAASPPGAGPRP